MLKGPEIPVVRIGNGTGAPVSLTAKLIRHVEAVLTPDITSIGTVEGYLEGLIIHGKRRFLIYDTLTGHQVTCYFGERVNWHQVYEAFGKRVAATGFIESRATGERVRLTVSRLHVFNDENVLPSHESVLGALKTAP